MGGEYRGLRVVEFGSDRISCSESGRERISRTGNYPPIVFYYSAMLTGDVLNRSSVGLRRRGRGKEIIGVVVRWQRKDNPSPCSSSPSVVPSFRHGVGGVSTFCPCATICFDRKPRIVGDGRVALAGWLANIGMQRNSPIVRHHRDRLSIVVHFSL